MKKLTVLGVLLLISIALAACSWEERTLYYQGELRTESQVEEIIADQLEVENPDLDLEVNIFEETED